MDISPTINDTPRAGSRANRKYDHIIVTFRRLHFRDVLDVQSILDVLVSASIIMQVFYTFSQRLSDASLRGHSEVECAVHSSIARKSGVDKVNRIVKEDLSSLVLPRGCFTALPFSTLPSSSAPPSSPWVRFRGYISLLSYKAFSQ